MSSKIGIVVIIVIVFYTNASELGDNGSLPSWNGLTIVDTVHPHGHGALFAIGSGQQGALESKVIASRERKVLLDLTQRGRVSLLAGFGSQKDVGLQLRVAIFGDKVTVE